MRPVDLRLLRQAGAARGYLAVTIGLGLDSAKILQALEAQAPDFDGTRLHLRRGRGA